MRLALSLRQDRPVSDFCSPPHMGGENSVVNCCRVLCNFGRCALLENTVGMGPVLGITGSSKEARRVPFSADHQYGCHPGVQDHLRHGRPADRASDDPCALPHHVQRCQRQWAAGPRRDHVERRPLQVHLPLAPHGPTRNDAAGTLDGKRESGI